MSDDDKLIRLRDVLALQPYDCDGTPSGKFDIPVFVKRSDIAALPAAQPQVTVKRLDLSKCFFVMHASGSVEFFAHEAAANAQSCALGRHYYEWGENALIKHRHPEKIRSAYDQWVVEEQAFHKAFILSALDLS